MDATGGTPLGDAGNGQGVAWGDYDNDGDLDLYLANYGQANKLFRNDGGGTFVDATSGPLGDAGSGTGVAWGDYDNDGDLDLYLANDGRRTSCSATTAAALSSTRPAASRWATPGAAMARRGATTTTTATSISTCAESSASANKLLRNDGGGASRTRPPSSPLDDARGTAAAWRGATTTTTAISTSTWPTAASANKLFRNDPRPDPALAAGETRGDRVQPGGHRRAGACRGGRRRAGSAKSPGVRASARRMRSVASFGLGATATVDSADRTMAERNRAGGASGAGGGQRADGREEPALFEDVAAGTPLADGGVGNGVAWGDYDNDGDLDLYLAN